MTAWKDQIETRLAALEGPSGLDRSEVHEARSRLEDGKLSRRLTQSRRYWTTFSFDLFQPLIDSGNAATTRTALGLGTVAVANKALHVPDGSTVDILRDALVTAGLMEP